MNLNDQNSHERDKRIIFDAEPHHYYVDGIKIPCSVTTLLHKYFYFDKDKIAQNCHLSGKKNPDSKYHNMSKKQILQAWEENGRNASLKGTQLHNEIENYYNTNDLPKNKMSIEFIYFTNFCIDYPDLIPYRTEWIVFHEEAQLAGSIDMVFKNKDGTVSIYDWKCIKEMKKTAYEKANAPLHIFPNSNYYQYSLQLNIYKYILETKYNKKVKDMNLVVLHDSNDNYELYPVDDLQIYVKRILEQN